jgi:enoyl-[acyl-carrier-protein] reductase (NADH)
VNPLAPLRTRDIAHAVLFLVSSLAQRITGQTLIVNGGAIIRDLWGIHEAMIEHFSDGAYGD